MLNVSEIAARIANPSITQAHDAEDLKLLAEKYPFTQLFSILYLQSLKQAGDVHFEDELKKHSFRITDRAQLFQLIESSHSVSAETSIPSEEQISEETKIIDISTLPEVKEEDKPIPDLQEQFDLTPEEVPHEPINFEIDQEEILEELQPETTEISLETVETSTIDREAELVVEETPLVDNHSTPLEEKEIEPEEIEKEIEEASDYQIQAYDINSSSASEDFSRHKCAIILTTL